MMEFLIQIGIGIIGLVIMYALLLIIGTIAISISRKEFYFEWDNIFLGILAIVIGGGILTISYGVGYLAITYFL